MPGIAEYANLVALTQYRQWARDLSRLPAQRDDLQRIFLAVAGLEADLTLCGHLRHGPATCPAEPASGLHLAFTELTHPLLDQPHPLSLQLNGQGAFITGQNGVGKSTLLRSVGLNVIVGQAFGFCYSRQALVPRVQVCSSLQIEDSLGTATSLYMAELERARWLCKVAQLRMRPAKSSCGIETAQGCLCPRYFIADTWTVRESSCQAGGHGGGMRRNSGRRLCRHAGSRACLSRASRWPMA